MIENQKEDLECEDTDNCPADHYCEKCGAHKFSVDEAICDTCKEELKHPKLIPLRLT